MKSLLALILPVILIGQVSAQEAAYRPGRANLESREWFRDAAFGMFIHWGVYSTLADGEWVMENRRMTTEVYEQLPEFFDPWRFNAREWVALAKSAGMKYITITAKHHDGFAMYDSGMTDWDIMDRTRFRRDPLAELAAACADASIRLFFYYSQLDWHHDDYYPRGRTGAYTGRPDGGSFRSYVDFMNAQLEELLTGYGPVGGIWFDGMWDKPDAGWDLRGTYDLIHRLQPATLVGSNHHVAPLPGEDFQMFEKDLPGGTTQSWSGSAGVSSLPLETAETMNGAWGYNIHDRDFKSTPDLIRYLVRAAGHDANFLLNVGPMPDGSIQPEFQKTLTEMGAWLEVYGESIYGTRGGPVPPSGWGVTTQNEAAVFVHLLDWSGTVFALDWPGDRALTGARRLDTGAAVRWQRVGDSVVLEVPDRSPGQIDLVLKLGLDAGPQN